MTPKVLSRLLGAYALLLFIASIVLAGVIGVDHAGEAQRSVVSVWVGGKRRARSVVSARLGDVVNTDNALLREARQLRGVRTIEEMIDAGPVLSLEPIIFGASFVAGQDGVEARYGDKIVYATVDDLVAMKAYDHPVVIGPIRLQLGVDPDVVLAALAKELNVPLPSLVEYGRFRRIAMHSALPVPPTGEVTIDSLKDAALAAGHYLARAVQSDGMYRYEVNAVTNEDSEGYNWPRHAGATWYLAESTNYAHDPPMIDAVQRAARRLSATITNCGAHRCVAEGDRADLGSSALGLLALVEVVEGDLVPELAPVIPELAEFLRSQQRPDGEFMHFYDRQKSAPIDEQVLYYTGEASFALARAARITKNPKDLEAASRALEQLVDNPFWYFAGHYYWGSEHWTCHALGELWDRAPNEKALRFCLDWQEAVRTTAIWGREASPAYDGATSAGPFVPPALVGTATRMEAAVSTLSAARKAGISAREIAELEAGIRHSLTFLLRYQLNPGPSHLMQNPDFMRGAFPSTTTDFKVRIDYPQHAGTALIKYLKQLEQGTKT